MKKSRQILMNYFDRAAEALGRPEAVKGLKEVISRGVKILVDLAPAKPSRQVREILEQHRTGRHLQAVEHIAASVQTEHKESKGEFIGLLELDDGSRVGFLPDVDIPNTEENRQNWRAFLSRLAPNRRTGFDPKLKVGGQVPFREGVWYGDLVFSPGSDLAVIKDVGEVRGSLSAKANRSKPGHQVVVTGALLAEADLLSRGASVVKVLGGDIHVYGHNLKGPSRLEAGPQALGSWGLIPGKRLVFSDVRAYAYRTEDTEEGVVHLLVSQDPGLSARSAPLRRYAWRDEMWTRLRAEFPMDTANAVRVKLERIRTYMGLPRDFIVDHTDNIQANIANLTAYMDCCLGTYNPGAASPFKKPDAELFQGLARDLAEIAGLMDLEGFESEKDLARRETDVVGTLERITDEDLRLLKKLVSRPMTPVDVSRIREDIDYLTMLTRTDLTLDEILVTSGRTIVFLNNVFISPMTKTMAAGMISRARSVARKLMGPKDAEIKLIGLLKHPDPGAFKRLRAAFPTKKNDVAALEAQVDILEERSPAEVVRDFYLAEHKDASEELDADRLFLYQLTSFRRGSVDEMFSWQDDTGASNYDTVRFRHLLWVNLTSFITEDIRRKTARLEEKTPIEIVSMLTDKLEGLFPIFKVFNSLSGGVRR